MGYIHFSLVKIITVFTPIKTIITLLSTINVSLCTRDTTYLNSYLSSSNSLPLGGDTQESCDPVCFHPIKRAVGCP